MDHLQDLFSCCRDLTSEKTNDRKKAAEKLRQLLSKAPVLKSLDRNVDQKQTGRTVTWDNVFKAVCAYIDVETQALQKARESQSCTTQLNREKRKQEISALFKLVVRVADKRGPRLKSSTVLSHIIEILKNPYTCSAYGLDYSNVLLKNLLSTHKYWVDMPSDTWHNLLGIYCKLFLDGVNIDRVILARVIRTLVSGATRQCDVRPRRLHNFFKEAFTRVRQEKIIAVLEHLVYALNTFIHAVGPNSRVQVCGLGEEIFLNMLYLWDNRPSEMLKDGLVEFFQAQIYSHHPGGVKQNMAGAYAVDCEKWMSHMRKLYEVLYLEFQQTGTRSRLSGMTKEAVLKPDFINLAVDVCHQLFNETSQLIEVTQLGSGDTQGGSGLKKRRLESGWAAVRDFITSAGHMHQVVPWIQLTTRLLEKYPESLPKEEVIPYLNCLAQLLAECKRNELIAYVLICVRAFAQNWSRVDHSASNLFDEESRSVWQKIWSTVLRSVSLNHAASDGYRLLTAVLEKKLVVPDKDVWSLFISGISVPTLESVYFLAKYLSLYSIPEKYQPSLIGRKTNDNSAYPLRCQLIDWLLPSREDEVENSNQSMVKVDCNLYSHTLMSLTLKDPSSLQFPVMGEKGTCLLHKMEAAFLQTALKCELPVEEFLKNGKESIENTDSVHIATILKWIENCLSRDCQYYCDIAEVKMSDIESMFIQASLLVKFHYRLLQGKILTPSMLSSLNLTSLLKPLLKKISLGMSEMSKKEGCVPLWPLLREMQSLFRWDDPEDEFCYVMADLCRGCTPTRLTDLLFELAVDKTSNRKASNTLSTAHSRRRSRILDDMDDMDLEYDEASGSKSKEDQEMTLDFDVDSQEDLVHSCKEESHPLLSDSHLSESQHVCVEAVRLLCLWCGFSRKSARSSIRLDVDLGFMKTKIGDLIDQANFDTNRPLDIQLLKVIAENLTTPDHDVKDVDLENIVDGLKNMAKAHRRDQEMCCVTIELLTAVVPHLADDLPSHIKKECRNIVLHLVEAFWQLQEKGDYTSEVRLAISKCIHSLVKIDPLCSWCQFPSGSSSGEESNSTPSSRLLMYVSDPCHIVRVTAAAAISNLFVTGKGESRKGMPRDHQNAMFDRLYEMLTDSLEIQGNLTSERIEDEKTNRSASVLLALSTVLCISPVCEKKAVFAMCQLIKETGLKIEFVKRVLDKVSAVLAYRSSKLLIESHLPYLIHQWYALKYATGEFPYQLLCPSPIEFYRNYHLVLVPELVMSRDLTTVHTVAKEIGSGGQELLCQCIPRIVVYILPLFAACTSVESASQENVKKRTAHATACYDLLIQEISQEVVENRILMNLEDIVVNVLMCLYDHSGEKDVMSSDDIRSLDPEPNPPCYNAYITTSTLDYLTKSYSGSAKSLVEVLSKSPDSIQKVLLQLSMHLNVRHRMHEKRQCLLMYRLFVKLLLREFHNKLGGAWAFILRDIIYRLLYLIKDMTDESRIKTWEKMYRDNIIELTLDLLREVCSVALSICSEELSKYLPQLISNLIPVAERMGGEGERAKLLLQTLVLENAAILKESISALDPFPDKPLFESFRIVHQKLKYTKGPFSLQQEIDHFLKLGHQYSSSVEYRLEGLKFLNGQLSSRPQQLIQLVQECEETMSNSLLCRLVCELVEMATSKNHSVAMAAAECLGAIGPVSLNTLSLPQRVSSSNLDLALRAFEDSPNEQKYCRIFHCLNDCLVDESVEMVKCASQVVKGMLATKTGANFYSMYKTKLADTEFLFHYLHPFRASKKKLPVKQRGTSNWEDFCAAVDKEAIWNPKHLDHHTWIKNLTAALIDSGAVQDELLAELGPMCNIKTSLCELILPYLVHDILVRGTDDHREILSRHIAGFFQDHCSQLPGRLSRCQSVLSDVSISMNKDSVRTLLTVVQYLRQQNRPKEGHHQMTPWDDNFWLDVDYLHMAKAAQFCSAHFTAVLYAEIWCDVQREKAEHSKNQSQISQSLSQSQSQETRIDSLSGSSSDKTGLNVQELLLEDYKWIGDPDGVYGCGAGRLADPRSRVHTYEHENQWDKAVITCDIMMKQTSGDLTTMLQAIQNFGASHILETYMEGIHGSETHYLTPEVEEFRYEASWRIGQWNLETLNKLDTNCGFHQALYIAMKASQDGHNTLSQSAIKQARLAAVKDLKEGSLESARCIYPVLSKLSCTTVVSDLFKAIHSSEENTNDIRAHLCCISDNNFEFTSPPHFAACSMLNLGWDKTKNNKVLHSLVEELQNFTKQAREAGRHQIAERCLQQLKGLHMVGELKVQLQSQMEEARLCWARDEHNIAKHLIRQLIDRLHQLQSEDEVTAKFYPQVLSIYGNWLAETHSENPNVILENYLEKTVRLLEDLHEDRGTAIDAYLSLARYADLQYQNIVNYMNSSTYEAKQSLMSKAQKELAKLKEIGADPSKDRYLRTLEKQSEIDQAELKAMLEDRTQFLLKAVENYIKCLGCGDQHNLRIFRLTSLWFSNAGNEEVNQMIQDSLLGLQTYKWLPLMYQLAARMDMKTTRDSSQLFLPTLNKIIESTAIDHPHHTLFCILALANASRDTEMLQQGRSSKRTGRLSKSQSEPEQTEEGRVQAAKCMVENLMKNKKVGAIVVNMKQLCDAYIQLANWSVQEYKTETKPIPLPSTLFISKIKDLSNVTVPTANIKVNPSCDYSNINYIIKFMPTFKLAGGINLPKIIDCVGSDGRSRRQLVKGRDDLRQDAVMQQVFEMVNNLLQKETETRKRRLKIRTYKVIPLSQRSGILEWCEGTQPFGEYLIGNPATGVTGAHPRYRPQDWSSMDCRKHMTGVHSSSMEKKYRAYQEICRHFQPVFRYFFMEKFSQPAIWFEHRLAYTRSVATNSIVGYILGLGDRHVQNILIDCNTAELIHIDLGVAFEQGRILPTPETVPFRLTRDIEDAMGVSGVEGVFRRCCEKTMEVMRNNQEALLTILEVLLYDPLYAWTISPAKAYALQQRRDRNEDTVDLNGTVTNEIMDMESNSKSNSETQENVNKLAERVLLRLRQKLQGVEDSVQLSVSGQVNHLIQEARNPKNLARLFPGWQPYL
ncbi:hypothetical protein CHS0354_011431 [Potamilus streckersoni]|uniref:non-specific serine/threonine protein kinase n=1 Tax=Potamilus streckersoni TaxID=2493646 RepID=A0AAE0SKY7_9BIVA|nr:hypothetical protein CHS0354_011431 [Potamilus streckersoni]